MMFAESDSAARIREGLCPGYETEPNLCRCTCEGCKHNCGAHREANQTYDTRMRQTTQDQDELRSRAESAKAQMAGVSGDR